MSTPITYPSKPRRQRDSAPWAEPILPGELGKALEILANGGDIDYVGATNVELIGPGEAAGTYREYVITGSAYETENIR